MEFLRFPLSEDLKKLQFFGMFEATKKRLHRELTERKLSPGVRKRLEFELFRLELLKRAYSFTEAEAFKLARKHFKGLTKREFIQLRDEGVIDWRWVEGRRMYESRFDSNLAFSSESFAQRFKSKVKSERRKRTSFINRRISELLNGDKPKKFRVRAVMALRAKNPNAKQVRVWLPFPKDGFQQSDVVLLGASHEVEISDNTVGQRTACMEGLDTEVFWIDFAYNVSEWVAEKRKINGETPEVPESTDLCEKPPHIVFTEAVRDTLSTVFEGRDPKDFDDIARARRIFDFVTLNVNYSFVLPYALYDNIVEYVLTTHRGDCGFQALTFITLCRAAGVPAKWQSGWSVVPWSASPHDWALVYLQEYGWVPVDLSFAGGRRGDENLRLFYFTNLDGFRMFANTEFQENFSPPKNSWRLDPYDNQVGEMEYLEVPETTVLDLDYSIEVKEFREV